MRPMIAEPSENFCWLFWVFGGRCLRCTGWTVKGVRTVPCRAHVLQTAVSNTVEDLECEVSVHPCEFQLVPQKCRLYGDESTGAIKEHDPYGASRLLHVRQWSVQEEDDGVIHSNARLIGKLEWVRKRTHQRMKMDEDQKLRGLHQVWSENNWSVAFDVLWVRDVFSASVLLAGEKDPRRSR